MAIYLICTFSSKNYINLKNGNTISKLLKTIYYTYNYAKAHILIVTCVTYVKPIGYMYCYF